jgi:hypothetical protein
MGVLDPTMRKISRLGLGLAGALIGEVQRRDASGSHRTPDRLLLQDASGMPGPALVGPIADLDMVMLPEEIDPTQAKELALAAGRVALHGAARRLLGAVGALPRTARGIPRALLTGGPADPVETDEAGGGEAPEVEPAERAAWERFVTALEKVTELQAAYAVCPDELAGEQLRWAEVELEDAVAVAGEFEVKKIRWLLA